MTDHRARADALADRLLPEAETLAADRVVAFLRSQRAVLATVMADLHRTDAHSPTDPSAFVYTLW